MFQRGIGVQSTGVFFSKKFLYSFCQPDGVLSPLRIVPLGLSWDVEMSFSLLSHWCSQYIAVYASRVKEKVKTQRTSFTAKYIFVITFQNKVNEEGWTFQQKLFSGVWRSVCHNIFQGLWRKTVGKVQLSCILLKLVIVGDKQNLKWIYTFQYFVFLKIKQNFKPSALVDVAHVLCSTVRLHVSAVVFTMYKRWRWWWKVGVSR